jgi:hypothetical protein
MMLRHIISVSLASVAMTACASLIPIKANAARLILIPVQPLGSNIIQRNPGDSIEFVLRLEDVGIRNPVEIQNYFIDYDRTELFLVQSVATTAYNNQLLFNPVDLAYYIFEVLEPVVKDGKSDISATINYRVPPNFVIPERFESIGTETLYDVEPVPEPLTIFGTATALGCGALFKRKSSKKKVS